MATASTNINNVKTANVGNSEIVGVGVGVGESAVGVVVGLGVDIEVVEALDLRKA